MVSIFDSTNPIMLTGVTDLEFNFYSTSNTQGRMDDPYNGVNPFTAVDDGLAAAFESPLIHEIDVIPEPASLSLLLLGGLAVLRRR